jgi:hypothetical protein
MAKKKTPARRRSAPAPPELAPAAVDAQPAAPETGDRPYTNLETYRFLVPLVLILIVIGWIGLNATEENRFFQWLAILVLMAAFVVIIGRAITGYWRGILIDARNKLSLSRLQMIAWSLLVLSAILTAGLSNVTFGWQTPMIFVIPVELWVVMGISTTSLVASPAILLNKAKQQPGNESLRALAAEEPDKTAAGVVVRNCRPQGARWADLILGEELGNFGHVDLGKMQMFLFTFILILSYAAALGGMFGEPGVITSLPNVSEGMNVLLGISHTGYLMNKAIAHTPHDA